MCPHHSAKSKTKNCHIQGIADKTSNLFSIKHLEGQKTEGYFKMLGRLSARTPVLRKLTENISIKQL